MKALAVLEKALRDSITETGLDAETGDIALAAAESGYRAGLLDAGHECVTYASELGAGSDATVLLAAARRIFAGAQARAVATEGKP